VSRHGGRELYRAAEADLAAWDSALRPKPCLLAKNRELQRIVAVKLKEDWAPQQIAGWLKDEYPGNPELWVSHETIYRGLFVQARGALKKELIGHLRSKRRIRRSRHATYYGEGRGQIIDAVSIRQRPAEVEDATDVQVYFCDPSSPWQRGSNENTNGLLRQYYPKGADLSGVSQAHGWWPRCPPQGQRARFQDS
jgi:IS30 family transposase